MKNKTAIVVGAGILGLATARALAIRGFAVTVIEKSQFSLGASVRNFGMLWPVGQPEGKLYNRALRTKEIWLDYLTSSNTPYNSCGSLHLAYSKEEMEVVEEIGGLFQSNKRPVFVISKEVVMNQYQGINPDGLLGALRSEDEVIIDPREGIKNLPPFLSEKFGINFIWGTAITKVESNTAYSGSNSYAADLICICSGADFETLFPELFKQQPIQKTKLQMMRFKHKDPSFKIGASVCGGLSLLHYKSFAASTAQEQLRKKIEAEMPEYLKNGIHVMVSQNNEGELTVGDSHEYGLDFDPFDRVEINTLILDYLKKFMHIDQWEMIQSWNGVYPIMMNGATDLYLNPAPGIHILNGIGGHGMTMSFGFAEEIIDTL
jgi:FAD dependent oxidoreductase TIGR03364